MKRTSKRIVAHRSPNLMDVGNVCIREVHGLRNDKSQEDCGQRQRQEG